jgi:hypothetical protein
MPEVYFRTGGIDTRRAFIPSQYLQLAKWAYSTENEWYSDSQRLVGLIFLILSLPWLCIMTRRKERASLGEWTCNLVSSCSHKAWCLCMYYMLTFATKVGGKGEVEVGIKHVCYMNGIHKIDFSGGNLLRLPMKRRQLARLQSNSTFITVQGLPASNPVFQPP